MNKELIAAEVHNAWWEEKKRQGFHPPLECSQPIDGLKFEPHCDKCHIDMYPYDELPENVKDYDRVTVQVVLNAIEKVQMEEIE